MVIEGPHPLGVAFGQIVVHGHKVRALAFERIQVERQRSHQGLAFAGLHLGDFPLVQNHAADQLHVEMAHLELALGHFPADGEGLGKEVIQLGALGQALSKFV